MSDDLKSVIEAAWEDRDSISTATMGAVREAVNETLERLDAGTLRVASRGETAGSRRSGSSADTMAVPRWTGAVSTVENAMVGSPKVAPSNRTSRASRRRPSERQLVPRVAVVVAVRAAAR